MVLAEVVFEHVLDTSICCLRNEKPASLSRSHGFCLSGIGSPAKMSRLQVGWPPVRMHLETHPAPEKSSRKV